MRLCKKRMINSWIWARSCDYEPSFVRQRVSSVLFHQVNLYKLCLSPIAVKYKLGKRIGDFKNCFREGLMCLLAYTDFIAWSLSTVSLRGSLCGGLSWALWQVWQHSWPLATSYLQHSSGEPTYCFLTHTHVSRH